MKFVGRSSFIGALRIPSPKFGEGVIDFFLILVSGGPFLERMNTEMVREAIARRP